jgi:hypothetical protein
MLQHTLQPNSSTGIMRNVAPWLAVSTLIGGFKAIIIAPLMVEYHHSGKEALGAFYLQKRKT